MNAKLIDMVFVVYIFKCSDSMILIFPEMKNAQFVSWQLEKFVTNISIWAEIKYTSWSDLLIMEMRF